MKQIKAYKVKNGWSIQIVDARHAYHQSDVIKLIKQKRMVIGSKSPKYIYADNIFLAKKGL